MPKCKNIILLGATGSVGSNTLQVIEKYPDQLNLIGIANDTQWGKSLEIAKKFNVPNIALFNETAHQKVKEHLPEGVQLHSHGIAGAISLAELDEADIVISAIVGSIGLSPTLAALKKGKTVALANKESLVMAGNIMLETAKKYKGTILPIDTEHNAIFQCIGNHPDKEIKKLIITASGGPFLKTPIESFKRITKAEALKHPNWDMGPKVTIDSSTMANKGLEIIEAYWLFGGSNKEIEPIIHPQSIVHSMVEYIDGNILAHLSPPSMTFAIQNALFYPNRATGSAVNSLDFSQVIDLTFIPPSYERFPCLKLAQDTLKELGNAPITFNASNEIAVDAFLKEKIHYLDISKIIAHTLEKIDRTEITNIKDAESSDQHARAIAKEYIDKIS